MSEHEPGTDADENTDLERVDDEPNYWGDSEDDVLAEATDDEIVEGNRQGHEIDVDDDEHGTESDE